MSLFYDDLQAIWAHTKGDPSICIAVIDTGVDLDHEALRGADVQQITFEAYDNKASSHGTFVAGVIWGRWMDALRGIAPECRGIIIPIYKKTEQGLSTDQGDLAKAIYKAIEAGAHLINISGGALSGSPDHSDLHLAAAVAAARNQGIQIVASVGNEGCDCLHVPASLPGVLAVGAVQSNGEPYPFNNYGWAYQTQGILSPMAGIVGPILGGGYLEKKSSSYAAPVITALIGLFCSLQVKHHFKIDPILIKKILLDTADQCNRAERDDCQLFLAGILNLDAALEAFKKLLHSAPDSEPAHSLNHHKPVFPMNSISSSNNLQSLDTPELQVEDAVSNKMPITPSDCGCGCQNEQLVYSVGTLGHAFPSATRAHYFKQRIGQASIEDGKAILDYLSQNPHEVENIIWTLNYEDHPMYALSPAGAFAIHTYEKLRQLYQAQLEGKIERVAVPGQANEKNIRLHSGQSVKPLQPALHGLIGWDIESLIAKIAVEFSVVQTPIGKSAVDSFFQRVFNDLRNAGASPQERALNFAATEAVQIGSIFEQVIKEELALSTIQVEKTPVSKPGTDCWDVKLTFFHPQKRMEQSKKIFRLTIDVNDTIPLVVGSVRHWSEF